MALKDVAERSAQDTPGAGSDFWQHRSLAELAEAQGVVPVEDVSVFFGTWPGEPDDGFEALIDEHRHAVAARS